MQTESKIRIFRTKFIIRLHKLCKFDWTFNWILSYKMNEWTLWNSVFRVKTTHTFVKLNAKVYKIFRCLWKSYLSVDSTFPQKKLEAVKSHWTKFRGEYNFYWSLQRLNFHALTSFMKKNVSPSWKKHPSISIFNLLATIKCI